jgi:spore coat protein U-like protein
MILAIMAMAGKVIADTATVGVSATVLAGSCRFNSGGTVSFTLDPSTGGNVAGTVTQPRFRCSRNAYYAISDDNGLHESGITHRMKHTALNEYIPYSFTYTTSGAGLGNGNPVTMDIASTVAEADYMDVPAGSYNDTVTLTINP